MKRCFTWFGFLLVFAICLPACLAQTPVPRRITGQVRLSGQPAPAGVPIILQIVASRYAAPSNETEVARTLTDRKGNFVFDHLESLGKDGGREFFAVSTDPAGYKRAWQVADLTFAAHGEVTLNLEKALPSPSPAAEPASGGDAAPDRPGRRLNPEAAEAIARGRELLFRKQDAAGSVDEFKKAVKSDPWYGQGYVLLGLAYMQLGRWSEAELVFEEGAKVEPGNIQAYVGMGSALNEQHDYENAAKTLARALELNPDSAEAHYELARSFAALEKWNEAAPHAQRAIEIQPDYAGPHALMGNVYLIEQDLPFALAEFQEYLRLDPQGSLAPQVKDMIVEIQKSMAEEPNKHP